MRVLFLFCALFLLMQKNNAQIINVSTKTSSLIYRVDNDKVYQIHYGKKISNIGGVNHLPIVHKEIYPSFGNGQCDEVALLAKHDDGTLATDLFYVSHQQNLEKDKCTTVIHLKDEKKDLLVDLYFVAYQEEDVIEQWASITNGQNGVVELIKFASSAIGLKAENYYLTHFYGSWGHEMHMKEEKLTNGIKTIETKRGLRATEYENPSFILSLDQNAKEYSGEIYMGALAWTGNFQLSFHIDDRERCQMTTGINPFASAYKLENGEVFETPKMIWTYSKNGKNQASINMHRWARKYNLRDGNQERPIVLNSWEGAYFDFDAKRLKKMMNGAAKMGVEVFVLDDGWFGNKYPRNHDDAGLGDWQVNKKKLPKGIDDLIDHAESLGIKFGIWVEPEMVNPKSELAENHPDWIIRRKNGRKDLLKRDQMILDLSNPDVQNFIYNTVDSLLEAHPRIAYIKWDANREVQNFGSSYLADDKQSHLWIEYSKGLTAVVSRLTEKHENVIFQACSSGGARVDYNILKHTHEFWASDDTDPYERLFIQWGTNHIYPVIATGSHVTNSPNHQTDRETPLKFRFDLALSGRLGVELSPDDLSKEKLEFAKNGIALYKKIRPIIQFGDLYRIKSPYSDEGYMAINYVDKDKTNAVLMVYSHDFHRRNERGLFKLKGLDSNSIYRITEVNKDKESKFDEFNNKTFTGDVLMNIGLKINLKKPMKSGVFLIKKVE